MPQTSMYDFRGGYATDLAPERMDKNMVLEGQNLWYKGKLEKRPGWTNLSTDATIHANTVRGFTRAYINGGWYNVVALDDGSYVNFYYGNTGAYTEITPTYNWTKDVNVEMVFFNDAVIAVNGTDKPAIIYYSGAWIAEDLEDYDERTRGNDEWYAGLWDDGASVEFIDDTTDAQSTTADDFQIATGGTNNDGFYVAGVVPFTKVVIKNCPQFDGTPVAEYRYYSGAGAWTAFTPTTTPTWTAAEGDKTLEFDLPLDSDGTLAWEQYGDLDSQSDAVDSAGDTVPGGVVNRYVIRIRFTTAPTSDMSCDYLQVSHTQYLTQIFLNDKPGAVCVHKNRLFLAAGRTFRYSPPNQVTDWNSRDIEYCHEGGEKIVAMVSAANYLVVLKEAGIYRYIGTTTENFVLRYSPGQGCASERGAASIGGNAVYVATDGIRVVTDTGSMVLSRHIQSDIDTWTKTNAVVAEWDGNLVVAFPTNDIILWADPDTTSKDEMGDGRMSFWEWTGLAADQIVYAAGSGDNGYLILHDMDNTRFVRNTTNGYDVAFDTTETAITTTFQTKYESYGFPMQKKAFKRIKVDMSESGTYTLTLYSNNGDAEVSKTIESGGGSGHHVEDTSIPYTLDGYNLSAKLVNATTNDVEIYGTTVDYTRRAF